MIVIVSNNDDQSTNEVIDWLYHYGVEFVRINEGDLVASYSVSLSIEGLVYDFKIPSLDIHFKPPLTIWYRRGGFSTGRWTPPLLEPMSRKEQQSLQDQVMWEWKTAEHALTSTVFNGMLNSPLDNGINKFLVLKSAHAVGLDIPETLITTNRHEVEAFKRKHGRIITKNLAPGVFVEVKNAAYIGFTEECSWRFIRSLPRIFPPSLFQRMVPKWIELRVFYLDGTCYASAIFSQQDRTTKVDFRNYNHARPNRTPPFKMDENVQSRLRNLMALLGLRSGSIDMIVTPAGQYLFLEVNPVGQFKQVSQPCNFRLEQKIAQQLIEQNGSNRTHQ
ncbi:MAG: grasp-with-spasm system ATP-grasp peptide maturase [Bacteroidetes bacterium]|nr:grasp-with-spasm system ATP-grasp peptide maturase [Bacteroidota bacterium]